MDKLTLCAMTDRTDRVFLAHQECSKQFDYPIYYVHVSEFTYDDSKGLIQRQGKK